MTGVRRPRTTLYKLAKWAADSLHEMGACPCCEMGHLGEDLDESARHAPECPLSGCELTVDIEALLDLAAASAGIVRKP